MLPGITNDHTRKMYKNSIKEFASYCKTEGIRKPSELSGKGGKRQLQRILQGHESEVTKIILEPKGKQGRILADSEIGSHINYHEIRREVARKSYEFYKDLTQNNPDSARDLKVELAKRYVAMHPSKPDIKKAVQWVKDTIGTADGDYILRGESKKKAEQQNRPVVYDRLSLLAGSVFHLSHWRLDVTVSNYMI